VSTPAARKPKALILLVEDHPVTRQGLAQLIDCQNDLQVCGQAGTADEAMQAVERDKPNLVIIDIGLDGPTGLELIKNLACRFPALPMLVLSSYNEELYAERSLIAGAKGYVVKNEPTKVIFHAIRQVLQGKVYLSPRMSERAIGCFLKGHVVAAGSVAERLSDRELEIFELIGCGHNTARIAAALKLHPSTVATHRAHIQAKLHLESLGELVCHAARWVQSQGP
jgi:DNA-binding NarL/FixJ family response regulator